MSTPASVSKGFVNAFSDCTGKFTGLLNTMYGPSTWERNPYVLAAKEEMRDVFVPSCGADIFNSETIASVKALFHAKVCEDPTPGFAFSDMDVYYEKTLECYWVDKHFSTADVIPTHIVEKVLTGIEKVVHKQLHGTANDKRATYGRSHFYNVEYRENQEIRPFRRSAYFWDRVLHRLRYVLMSQLYQEFPPPVLPAGVLRDLKGAIARGGTINVPHSLKENSPDWHLHKEYTAKMYDERDKRMVKILREAFEKDKRVRESNPNAPLTHLVTLEAYEEAIERKKTVFHTQILDRQNKIMYAKVAAVALGFFFFIICLLTQTMGKRTIVYRDWF